MRCVRRRRRGGGASDAWVGKLNPTATAFVYATFLGRSGDDAGLSISVDLAKNAYVAGSTTSTDFPVWNAFQSAYGGGASDGFVAGLGTAAAPIAYAAYLGGSGRDQVNAIAAVPSYGATYVTGVTDSTNLFGKAPSSTEARPTRS